MKLALAYSTKDRVELTEQTVVRVLDHDRFQPLWLDGSITAEGSAYFERNCVGRTIGYPEIRGGADAAIVFALTQMLQNESYTHVGLLENDVLLPDDWFERTLALFEQGERDGLAVGAVTARTYEDRVLIQRDGYAVLHNAGAGHVVFTRRAAELVLEFYRTGWWNDNRAIFSQLSGLDIGQWGAFRTNSTSLTADWHFDTILAAHGLATLGLTPSSVRMIGQDPPLEEQGLKIADAPVESLRNDAAFDTFRHHTRCVREGHMQLHLKPWLIQQQANGSILHTYFPHQFDRLGASWKKDWHLRWHQGHGPFGYQSNGATLSLPVFGPCAFMISGGEKGARVKIADRKSGYEVSPEIAPETHGVMALPMPSGLSYRQIDIEAEPGVCIYSLQTSEPQPWFPKIRFDYRSLPPVRD